MKWIIIRNPETKTYNVFNVDCPKSLYLHFPNLTRNFARYVKKYFSRKYTDDYDYNAYQEFIRLLKSQYYSKRNQQRKFWSTKRVSMAHEAVAAAAQSVVNEALTCEKGDGNDPIFMGVKLSGRMVVRGGEILRLKKKLKNLKKALDMDAALL